MRLEAIEKEANLYRGEGECYIHIEKTAKTPMACVMSGDKETVAYAMYNILFEVSRQIEMPFESMIKMYKRAYKKFGEPKRTITLND